MNGVQRIVGACFRLVRWEADQKETSKEDQIVIRRMTTHQKDKEITPKGSKRYVLFLSVFGNQGASFPDLSSLDPLSARGQPRTYSPEAREEHQDLCDHGYLGLVSSGSGRGVEERSPKKGEDEGLHLNDHKVCGDSNLLLMPLYSSPNLP